MTGSVKLGLIITVMAAASPNIEPAPSLVFLTLQTYKMFLQTLCISNKGRNPAPSEEGTGFRF